MTQTTDVTIIGGGPAGLACAIWLKKLGVAHVLLEGSGDLGGLQTRSPYENLWLPGVQGKTGQEVAADLSRHAQDVKVTLVTSCPAHEIFTTAGGYRIATPQGDFITRQVVVATGTQPRTGGFTPSGTVAIGPGTPMEALEVAGKRVAILGGGDNAFDQAAFVRARGGEVTVFSRSAPRAQKMLQATADVRVVIGDYAADQETMTVASRLGREAFDAFGVMYGFEAVVPEGLNPRLDNGYIAVDRLGETSLPNVYACGEVTDYWHPCVATAIAHGVQVAKQISLKL